MCMKVLTENRSVDKCDHYSSSAVRICRRLGLHRMNEDPTSLPEGAKSDEDPAFRGASPHFWRQQALLALSASLSVDNENHRTPPSFDAGEGLSCLGLLGGSEELMKFHSHFSKTRQYQPGPAFFRFAYLATATIISRGYNICGWLFSLPFRPFKIHLLR